MKYRFHTMLGMRLHCWLRGHEPHTIRPVCLTCMNEHEEIARKLAKEGWYEV